HRHAPAAASSRRNFARLAANRREPRYVFSVAPSLQVPFPEIEDARPGGFGGNCVVVDTRGEAKSVMRVRENLESMLGPRLFQRSLQLGDDVCRNRRIDFRKGKVQLAFRYDPTANAANRACR